MSIFCILLFAKIICCCKNRNKYTGSAPSEDCLNRYPCRGNQPVPYTTPYTGYYPCRIFYPRIKPIQPRYNVPFKEIEFNHNKKKGDLLTAKVHLQILQQELIR